MSGPETPGGRGTTPLDLPGTTVGRREDIEPVRVQRRRALLAEEMARVRELVLELGELVDEAISRAIHGLTTRNPSLCTAVVEDDATVNEVQRQVRELGFMVILTQAPVAGDLREIMSDLHMAAELERIGDHAASIARIGRQLSDLPELTPGVDVARMGTLCSEQVRDILAAVVARDVDRAREIAGRDDRIDRVYHRLFDELLEAMHRDGDCVVQATSLIFVAHHLERIGDRVTNIAEDLVFLETGEIVELD